MCRISFLPLNSEMDLGRPSSSDGKVNSGKGRPTSNRLSEVPSAWAKLFAGIAAASVDTAMETITNVSLVIVIILLIGTGIIMVEYYQR